MGRDVDVQVGDLTMKVYLSEPDGPARGAVVLLQEAFGVNGHIRDVTDRFARAGYLTAAPHLFHRTGDPELGYEDMSQVVPHFAEVNVDTMTADIGATLDLLATKGYEGRQVGVVGFCMGGTLTFLAATTWDVGAAVTFYGGGVGKGRFGMRSLVELAPELRAPWLGLFGDLDGGIPVDDVEALRVATGSAAVDTEVVRYADADHGFHCDARSSYHEPSATDAWARTLAWFDQHLA